MPAPMVAPETSIAASASGRGIGRVSPTAPQITTATIAPDIQAAGMPRRWKRKPPSAARAIWADCAATAVREEPAKASDGPQRRGEPAHRLLEVFGFAGEAQAQIPGAALPEGGAGRKADIRFVDKPHGERARIRDALHLQEGVERAGRRRQLDLARGVEPFDNDLAPAPGAGDLVADEAFALLDRGDRGALLEHWHARGRVLDQVLDHLPERGRRLEPADAP